MCRLIIMIVMLSLSVLTGCSSRTGDPADITDANVLVNAQGSYDDVQTQGLGEEENMVAKDVGPTKGLLGKRSLYFAYESRFVYPKYYSAIREHGQYLASHPKAKILLEGNTDIRGSREWNIALGYNRAKSVFTIMRQQGAKDDQIRIVSYGPEKPVALGHAEEDYQLNRRVDIVYEAN